MNFDFPTILVLGAAITGLIWAVDAMLFAPRRRALAARMEATGPVKRAGVELAPPKEPVLVEYAKSFFPVIVIVLLLRSFLVEPFRIPSGSMMPTLLVGDFILVNKFTYGIRLPVTNQKVIEMGSPQRGDVVVFRYPQSPTTDYIKRVVGVPGDRIRYRNKLLYVNGEPARQTNVGVYTGIGSGISQTGFLERRETIGELEHAVLVNPLAPDYAPNCRVLARGEITLPEGHYFVMGDNRDNSNDSRCWGLVPEDYLVGKAFAIWMSWDGNRSGFPLGWERIGSGIQ